MKQVKIKLEGSHKPYHKYYDISAVRNALNEAVSTLEEGQALQITTGKNFHFIDYDEEQSYDFRISEVMYYVKMYLPY